MRDDPPWYNQRGVKERWDKESDTGPHLVVLAKLAHEGKTPFIAAAISGAIVATIGLEIGINVNENYQLTIGAFAGVFLFLYFKAGFKDSTLRKD